MDEKVLIVSISLKDVEVRSTQEVINQSIGRVSVPAEIVARKNHKEKEIGKKTRNASKKRYENKASEKQIGYNGSSTIIYENTNKFEHKSLSGKVHTRESTIKEQSENAVIVKHEQSIIVSINLKYVEVRSRKEVINRSDDRVYVPVNSVVRKNQMESEIEKKTVNHRKKSFQNKAVKEKKTDYVSPTTVSENTNSSVHKKLSETDRKRKVSTEEHSENGTKLVAEDNTSPNNRNTKNFEEIKDSTEIPKRKTSRKENSENIVNQNTEDDANSTRRKVEENESDRIKKSRRNTVLPKICEILQKSEAWRLLRKPSGTSYEEISKIVAEKYRVEINRIKPLVESFYQQEIANGWCEKISGNGGEEKFRATNTLYSSYRRNEDNASPVAVCKNTNSSEHENLTGTCLRRKTTIEKQSENGVIAKNEQVLIVSISLKYLEVRNIQRITNRSVDRVSVSTNSAGVSTNSKQEAKEIKKKTANTERKKTKNKVVEAKAAHNASPMIACENINSSEDKNSSETGLKRKPILEKQSETGVMVKHEHGLIVSISLKYVEVRSRKEVTNRSIDRISVPANNDGSKNQMEKEIEKKTADSRKKSCQNKTTNEKTTDSVSSMIVCENSNSSELLSRTGRKRKASIEEQSENSVIVKRAQVLIVSISLKYVEVRNTQEVTNRSSNRDNVSANSAGRKNKKGTEIEKKTVNAKKNSFKNEATKMKMTDNASPMVVRDNTSSSEHKSLSGTGRKRKASIEEQSENGTEQKTESNTSPENRNAKHFEEQKDSMASPMIVRENTNSSEHNNLSGTGRKRKASIEEQSENCSEQKTEGNTSPENINAKHFEEQKNITASPMNVHENTNSSEHKNLIGTGRERKVSIEEESENSTEQKTEGNTSPENRNAKHFEELKDSMANPMIVRENTNSSEHNNLSGTGRKRKASIEEQSENGTEQKTESNTSPENIKAKHFEEQKASMVSPMIVRENTNSSEHNNLSGTGRKRKASIEEQSENGNELKADGTNTSPENINAKNFEEQKNSTECPKRKCSRKKKSENIANEKTEVDTNKNTRRKVKENKSDRIKKSTRKTVLPPICEMLLKSEAWRLLKNPKGTSHEQISKIVAEKYQVEINRIKPLVESFYQQEIANGWCEQVRGSGDEEKIRATNTLYFSYKGNAL